MLAPSRTAVHPPTADPRTAGPNDVANWEPRPGSPQPEDGHNGPADHEQTQAAALAALRRPRDAATGGDHRLIGRLYREARAALDEHERAGCRAVDRMARARHGETHQARLTADRGRTAFRRKLDAARAQARNHVGPVWDAMLDKAFGDLGGRGPWVGRYPWLLVTKGTDGGRWVTIGGTKGADGKRHGGSPVFIRDGRIVKGHPSLVGRKIGALKEAGEHGSHRSQLNQSRAHEVAVWRKKARKAGHDPKHLDQLAGEIKAHHDAFANERKDVLRFAREHSKKNGYADLRQTSLTAARGGDWTGIRGFDNTAEATRSEFPHHFREESGEHGGTEDQLYDMLTAGDPYPMAHAEAYEQAFDRLGEAAPKGPKRSRKPAADYPAEWDQPF